MSFLEIDKKIGYGFLKSALNLPVFEPKVTASLSSSVRKITHKDNQLWWKNGPKVAWQWTEIEQR